MKNDKQEKKEIYERLHTATSLGDSLLLSSLSKEAVVNLLKLLVNHAKINHKISLEQLLNIYHNPSDVVSIPSGIFSTPISPAESLCKYLKEECDLTFHQIGVILDRNERSIWISYQNAVRKQKARFQISEEDIGIPLSAFKRSRLSVFETAIYYLVKNYHMSCKKISEAMNKNTSTIWTVYNRARKKLGE